MDYGRPLIRTVVLKAALMATGIALAQPPAATVKVATVCEVLGNVDQYADTAVAIIGRMERSASLIDHYDFLSQDRCAHSVVTHGHTWSNQIEIETDWEEGMPKPPSDAPTLERTVIAGKLSAVRKTTPLGSHTEPGYGHGKLTRAVAPNKWAVVYGRIVRSPRLSEDCRIRGCGGDDAPLILIATPESVHTLKADGTLVAGVPANRG